MGELYYQIVQDGKFGTEVGKLEDAPYFLKYGQPTDYVIAVENGKRRDLNEEEESRLLSFSTTAA